MCSVYILVFRKCSQCFFYFSRFYDHLLIEPLKNLCFETGDMFYNMTKRFSEAVQEYNEAYTALSDELKGFHEKWKELSDEYYK